MKAYEWKPIKDLPADWTTLASSELAGLASVWREHYETIKDSKALKQFNERLRREWAIETGIIENLYFINDSATQTLIERGIEASLIPHGSADRHAELIIPILKDQEAVIEGLFDFISQRRHLSTSYIKLIHQELTRHQQTTSAIDAFGNPLEVSFLRGEWKKLPNNPTKKDGSVHEYCPPEHVASEMDRLIELHQEHFENQVPPEVEAAWLHHRFTQIHPFQDGNGRIARTLASLIFLRSGLFPLVVHRDERDEYIDVLEAADWDEINSLTLFFASAQKKAINQALSLSENILSKGTPLNEIIGAGIDRLQSRAQFPQLINDLERLSFEKAEAITLQLNKSLQSIHPSYSAFTATLDLIDEGKSLRDSVVLGKTAVGFVRKDNKWQTLVGAYKYLFRSRVEQFAQSLGHQAQMCPHYNWVALTINDTRSTQLVISFYSLGAEFTGVMAALAFIRTSESAWAIEGTDLLICEQAFQFAVTESENSVVRRFQKWLDEVFLVGFNLWRRQN